LNIWIVDIDFVYSLVEKGYTNILKHFLHMYK